MKVLLIFSGSYPYYYGGVSTWANYLTKYMANVDFDILAVISNPFTNLKYTLSRSVKNIYTIPLWGCERLDEYYRNKSLLKIFFGQKIPQEKYNKFMKHLPYILEYLLGLRRDSDQFIEYLMEISELFKKYDYNRFWIDKTWSLIKKFFKENFPFSEMNVKDIVDIYENIRALFRIFCVKLPKYDLIHSAIASFSGLIGVIKKVYEHTPYILTEHGVYFRERVLELSLRMENPLQRFFWKKIYRSIVALNYIYADKILPVNKFNREWEIRLGANPEKIEVVYNGIDINKFTPQGKGEKWKIISLIRVTYLKDPLNLIEATRILHRKYKNIVVEVYGPIEDYELYLYCIEKIKEYRLEKNFFFKGYTDKPQEAYKKAWVIVLPSISEGTPFVAMEAMACGKPVVATDVGGVRDIIGDAGIVVPPRAPGALAKAIEKILIDESFARELRRRGRERAEKFFSIEKMIQQYETIYRQVAFGDEIKILGASLGRGRSFS